MEDVLDVYELPYDPLHPQLCFDEKPIQLLGDKLVPIPMKPGKSYKSDYHYERKGVCCIFMIVEPLTGWRFAQVRDQKTKLDYAHFVKKVVDKFFPHVEYIRLVQDNLNTHNPSSFYEAFQPEEAHRLKNKFEFHSTPVGASWLNMAEIELSALSRQCLNRRISAKHLVASELDAWLMERNQEKVKINWTFNTNKARNIFKEQYGKILKLLITN